MTPFQEDIMTNTMEALQATLADVAKNQSALINYKNDKHTKPEYSKLINDVENWSDADIGCFWAAFDKAFTETATNAKQTGAFPKDIQNALTALNTYIPQLTNATDSRNRMQSVSDNVDMVLLTMRKNFCITKTQNVANHQATFFSILAAGAVLSIATVISAAMNPK